MNFEPYTVDDVYTYFKIRRLSDSKDYYDLVSDYIDNKVSGYLNIEALYNYEF